VFETGKSLKFVITAALTLMSATLRAQTADATAPKLHMFTNVSGTGTSGRLVKWADNAGALADSVITESAGQIGIGTASPTGLLHLYSAATGDAIAGAGVDMLNGPSFNFGYAGNSIGRSVGFLNVRPDASATAPNPSLRFLTANVQRVIITNTGAVGIGTMDPEAGLSYIQESPLHVYSNADKNTLMRLENAYAGVNSVAAFQLSSNVANVSYLSHSSARTVSRYGVALAGWNEIFSWGTSNGLIVGTGTATPLVFGTNNVSRMTIDSSGTFTIGSTAANSNVTINGTLTATKVIGAVYQDVAEWVPATTHMEPGTVVVLNRERRNEVMPSARSYDTAVAGVVSENPGVVLGVASDSKAQIATTGRVKVHVDATAGAIAIGDLLVTSDKSGMAMKSQPVDLGGVQFHRPGTVIGKALEPLPRGEGEILVLLSLQ